MSGDSRDMTESEVPAPAGADLRRRPPGAARKLVVDAIEKIEDGIYLFTAVLLVIGALLLVVNLVTTVVTEWQRASGAFAVVFTVLEEGLLLFMVAELLYTVRATLRDRTLAAEPFLVVGLIAGIRRVLILTAKAQESFSWQSEGLELTILIGLIVAISVAIIAWRLVKPSF